MPFQFNPHRHVKIWLTRDPSSFLNLKNRLRLIEMREKNPKDEIHFIFDSALMHDETVANLHMFCSTFKIIPYDLRANFLEQCNGILERKLLAIYDSLIKAFFLEKVEPGMRHGAILGFCSDMLRYMSFVYLKGTYSDLDVNIDTRKLAENVIVDKPLLLGFDSCEDRLIPNNDVIAIVDEKSAFPIIQSIQKDIIRNCEGINGESVFSIAAQHSPTHRERYELRLLHTVTQSKTIIELFKTILEVTATVKSYRRGYMRLGIDPHTYVYSVSGANCSPEIAVAALRHNLLNKTLMTVSGAYAIRRNLNIPLSVSLEMLKENMLYATSTYNLASAFPGQSYVVRCIMTGQKASSHPINDMSFEERGWDKIKLEEEKIIKAAGVMRDRWLALHPRVSASAGISNQQGIEADFEQLKL